MARTGRPGLTPTQQQEIWQRWQAGESLSDTARALGRQPGSIRRVVVALGGIAPSTISRETRRHGGRAAYRTVVADAHAWDRALRPKCCRLAGHLRLRRLVAGKLRLRWSPEQMAGWLGHTFPAKTSLHLSHETIYRSLYVQAHGVLRRELLRSLRTRRTMRHSRRASHQEEGRGQSVAAVPISARPPEVADPAVPGHWEGDLIAGAG